MKHLSFLLAPLLLATSAFGAPDEIEKLDWGGVTIRIPVPEGFVRIDGLSEEFDKFQQGFIPQTNQLLAMFSSPEDAELLRNGDFPEMIRTLNIQGLNQFKAANISERDFGNLREELKKQYKNPDLDFDSAVRKLEESGAASLEEVIGADAKVNIGGITTLGVFHDDKNSASFAMTLTAQVEVGDAKEGGKSIATGSFVRLHGKVINLYCNTHGTSPDDMRFARSTIVGWKDDVIAANSDLAEAMASMPMTPLKTENGNMKRVGSIALIAGVIAGVIAVVVGIILLKD